MDYETLATKESVQKTSQALTAKGYEVFIVSDKTQALDKIKELIPNGASVNNGASKTLEQIGYIGYLKNGAHGWDNLKEKILAEKDPAKAALLRKQATISDFYLGSVNALLENGEFVIGSNTASQMPGIVFNAKNLIFVVSTKKIVPDLSAAFKRLEDHVKPLEDQNIRQKFGVGTRLNKIIIFKGETAALGRKVRMILVEENLGF